MYGADPEHWFAKVAAAFRVHPSASRFDDLTALMDHTLTREAVLTLPGKLASHGGALAAAVQSELAKTFDPQADEDWNWERGPGMFINGPAGFTVRVSQHLLKVHTSVRFQWFLGDQPTQAALVPAFREIGHLAGASTIIYLPDSSFASGAALDAL